MTQQEKFRAAKDLTVERLQLDAIPYWDYSQWTVGFGTACPDAFLEHYQKEGIPLEEAENLMDIHIKLFNRDVNRFMTRYDLSLTQHDPDFSRRLVETSILALRNVVTLYSTGLPLRQSAIQRDSDSEQM